LRKYLKPVKTYKNPIHPLLVFDQSLNIQLRDTNTNLPKNKIALFLPNFHGMNMKGFRNLSSQERQSRVLKYIL